VSNRARADDLLATNVAEEPGRRVPGQPDMWAFVLFETLLFTSYFAVYLFNRAQNHELYLRSQGALDLRLGIFSTIMMLTSSWAIARCVQAARDGRYPAAMRNAFVTVACGLVFLGAKVFEWVTQVRRGNTFSTNDFFQHYYFLTAIHCLHLLIGFVAIGVVVYQLRSPARRCQQIIETGATYWHTVDLLWILIFAMLYVVR
jgi:nitric oxide reductase NorE protein